MKSIREVVIPVSLVALGAVSGLAPSFTGGQPGIIKTSGSPPSSGVTVHVSSSAALCNLDIHVADLTGSGCADWGQIATALNAAGCCGGSWTCTDSGGTSCIDVTNGCSVDTFSVSADAGTGFSVALMSSCP